MTNIDFIERSIKRIEEITNKYSYESDNVWIKYLLGEKENLEKVKKDLEILEIIKTHYRSKKNTNEDLLVLEKPINYKDANKIKRWLDNGKN